MFKRFSALIVFVIAMPLTASGPYSPVRIDLQRDEVYNEGKALYSGAMKVGTGSSCNSCHSGASSLSRAKLAKIKFNLEGKVRNCMTAPDRANGSAAENQLEALVHYLAKRYRL